MKKQDLDVAELWRIYPLTGTSVPTPPSRAHLKDYARSKQLPQIIAVIAEF